MGALRGWHIVVLLIVVLLLFGAPRLPDLARSLGKSLRILKEEAKALTSDDDSGDSTESTEGLNTSSAKDESKDD